MFRDLLAVLFGVAIAAAAFVAASYYYPNQLKELLPQPPPDIADLPIAESAGAGAAAQPSASLASEIAALRGQIDDARRQIARLNAVVDGIGATAPAAAGAASESGSALQLAALQEEFKRLAGDVRALQLQPKPAPVTSEAAPAAPAASPPSRGEAARLEARIESLEHRLAEFGGEIVPSLAYEVARYRERMEACPCVAAPGGKTAAGGPIPLASPGEEAEPAKPNAEPAAKPDAKRRVPPFY